MTSFASPMSTITGRSKSAISSRRRIFYRRPSKTPSGDRTRPNLKIQDGCNNRCSFCIIPYVRGKQPQRAAGSRGGAGAHTRREISRSGAQRHQPRPLGTRFHGRSRKQTASGRSRSSPAGRNAHRASAPELRRADGFFRRTAATDGRVAAHRASTCTRRCNRARTRCCAACIASIARVTTPTASRRRAIADARLRRRRRRDDRLPRRD